MGYCCEAVGNTQLKKKNAALFREFPNTAGGIGMDADI